MENTTNVYLCLLRGEYNVIRAKSLEEASIEANEMGGFTIRRAFASEWYEDEDGINYMGD
jgi:hypothetical protein